MIFADILRVDKNMVAINLSSNDIGPEGATAIFNVLMENQTLISLNISSS